MHTRVLLLLAALLQLIALCCPAADNLGGFQASLKNVFTSYYPAVTLLEKDGIITFDHATRVFQIHAPLKTGEWQDAFPQRGPNKGGIYCEIVSQTGVYSGAAVVPQTFDQYYFKILLLAPYSKRLNQHLHVRLFYPADVSEKFLKSFTDAVNRFEDF